MLPSEVRRVLVVEDDTSIREGVGRILRGWGAEVVLTGTVGEAKASLSEAPPPDLILADVCLPDDPVFSVLEAAKSLSPAPIVVAMSGVASPDETFRLGHFGVRAYLPKPFDFRALASAIEEACGDTAPLEPAITARVGRVPMRDVQRQVRLVMVKEALARAGSRSGAARLLRVTRQAVQQILRSQGNDDDDDEKRDDRSS